MNLLDIYKKTTKTLFANPAITMFFILYMIISSLFGGYVISAKSPANMIILFLCMVLFSLCFISGWLEIIKENTNTINENKNSWNIFLEGIGKNIFSIGIGFLIYGFLFALVVILSGKIAHSAFGSLDFISKDILTTAQNNQALINYFNSLNDNQKYIISAWQLTYIFSTLTFSFLMLFFYPAIIFNEKTNAFLRPFVAIKDAFCFLFKNFFGALAIHISIFVVYMLFSYMNLKFGENVIASILLLFCYIYFISGAIMLIFNYYEQRNNCANRCDCIRENEDINQSSKEL